MRLHILSDIHLEFGNLRHAPPECDAVIVAGDAHVGCAAIPWLAKTFVGKPVIYIAGNHEFYGGRVVSDHYEALRKSAAKHGVHFLQDSTVEVAGARFVGATLWTDFALHGDAPLAGWDAERGMNDFRQIKSAGDRYDGFMTRDDWLAWHHTSRAFITDTLAQPFDGPTIVVTHHAPSEVSVPPRFKQDRLSPSYASRLEDLMLDFAPELWVHGHIHDSLLYDIGQTRVVCNPRGYHGHELNPDFELDLVVEIGRNLDDAQNAVRVARQAVGLP